MAQFAKDRPFIDANQFDLIAAALDDGAGAYGSYANPGTGGFVIGSALKARRIEVTSINGALTGAPTGLKIALLEATDANGTGAAAVTGTDTEFLTPAASTKHMCEFDLTKAAIDVTKYYGTGAALNGAGTTALTISTISRFLDAPQVS